MYKKSPVAKTIIILLAAFLILPAPGRLEAFGQTTEGYTSEVAFPQLTFSQPVAIVSSEDRTNRLFVVEQQGTIRVFENSPNMAASSLFLDLRDRVFFGGEQGLLGLAFHPNYAQNGYFYVDYVTANPTRTVIARFSVTSTNLNSADKNSQQVLIEIPQPFSNHKGGQLAFGLDGYLYIGMGDGGSQGDPQGNSQSLAALLGKILRIDVDNPSGGRNYGIPLDNPFRGNKLGYREEIFAFGFRNPWRFSIDSVSGRLWVGDVGQNQIEEIDIVERGRNYGWNIMEGSQCYNPTVGCDQTGLELPVYEYSHALGYAIIGGYVYHGQALPGLKGVYMYGDYGSGRIWALTINGTGGKSNVLLVSSNLSISSFGLDQSGELFFCTFDGKIHKLNSAVIPELPVWAFGVLFAVATLVTVMVFKRHVSAFEKRSL
jgi:glucose/arabinose dehydrogenase